MQHGWRRLTCSDWQADLDLLVTRASGVGLLTIAEFGLAAERLLGVHVDIVTDGDLAADHEILRTAVAA